MGKRLQRLSKGGRGGMSQTKGLYRSYILMFVSAFGAFHGNFFFFFVRQVNSIF